MDLSELHASVRVAREKFDEPPPPGGSKPILPLTDYFELETHALLRQVVREIRRGHPAVFANYAEATMAWLVVEELAARDEVPSLEQVAHWVGDRVEQDQGPWLISTPLSNITLAEAAAGLCDGAVIWRAHLSDDWLDDPWTNPEDDSEFLVFELLGDRVRRPTRWRKLLEAERLDSRIGATVLSIETGTIAIALARARAKVRYAIAVWAIVAPPDPGHALPELGLWVPPPWVEIREPHKRLEVGKWLPNEPSSNGSIRRYEPYAAPGVEALAVPFDAIKNAEKRSAQALLSASLSLLQASRGSRFTLSERLRFFQAAVDALCEPPAGQGGVLGRWGCIAQCYGVWEHLRGYGYVQSEVEEAQARLYQARNISTHGRDAVLIDLGYPSDVVRALRKGEMAGADLAVSGLESDLTPLVMAVRHVLRALWDELPNSGWDDEAGRKIGSG
jgi:hypothetical protein